jgi:hypothetical protein
VSGKGLNPASTKGRAIVIPELIVAALVAA